MLNKEQKELLEQNFPIYRSVNPEQRLQILEEILSLEEFDDAELIDILTFTNRLFRSRNMKKVYPQRLELMGDFYGEFYQPSLDGKGYYKVKRTYENKTQFIGKPDEIWRYSIIRQQRINRGFAERYRKPKIEMIRAETEKRAKRVRR